MISFHYLDLKISQANGIEIFKMCMIACTRQFKTHIAMFLLVFIDKQFL
jgi:hypothetical protein